MAWAHSRDEIVEISHFVVGRIAGSGPSVEYCDVETVQTSPCRSNLESHHLLLDKSANELNKNTFLGYKHLGVQPYLIENGLQFDPFPWTLDSEKFDGGGGKHYV